MRYSLLFSAGLLFLLSCNKSKFNTIPSLKIKSVNTSVVRPGQPLIITLAFTDAEGDLSDSFFVQEKVLNCPAGGFAGDTLLLPAFPTTKNQEGEIIVSFGYRTAGTAYPAPLSEPKCSKNDTAIFKFVLKDKAKHKSDTAVSDKIVVVY